MVGKGSGKGGGGGGVPRSVGGTSRGNPTTTHHLTSRGGDQLHPHQNGPAASSGAAAAAAGGPGAAGGRTVQCGPHQYRLGLYGWRRRCLYALVLLLLVMVILNLALTLFILRVLDFTAEGIGGLQIGKGGLIAKGEVHVMDTLVAARILSRPHTPVRVLAADNFSISATDAEGRVTNTIFMNSEALECTTERLVIRDKVGRLLFSATRDAVLVGARQLTVEGEGGAVFSGSVQTSHVTAPIGSSLLLESLTRSLEVTAPQGIALESRAGTITAECLHDFTLQSTAGVIKFDTPNIFVQGLPTSNVQTEDKSLDDHAVYQLCVCSSGRLFLARPKGVCAANSPTCK